MIKKVNEVYPRICPSCGGQMRIIAFITDNSVVGRIINQLKLRFVTTKPPALQVAYQELLMAAEMKKNIFKILLLPQKNLPHVPTPAQRIYLRENLDWIFHESLAFKKTGEGQ